MEQINGVNIAGEPIKNEGVQSSNNNSEPSKYGEGAIDQTDRYGVLTRSYPKNAKRKEADLGDMYFDGAFNPEETAESLDFYNAKPVVNKDSFFARAKERNISDDEAQEMFNYLNDYSDIVNKNYDVGKHFTPFVKAENELMPFSGAYTNDGINYNNTITSQQMNESAGFYVDSDGNFKKYDDDYSNLWNFAKKSLSYIGSMSTSYTNYGNWQEKLMDESGYLVEQFTDTGESYWREKNSKTKDIEGAMRSFWGPKKYDSSWYGDLITATSSALPSFLGYARSFLEMTKYKVMTTFSDKEATKQKYLDMGMSDGEASRMAVHDFEKNDPRIQAANYWLNVAEYYSHKNYDQEGSILDDDFDGDHLLQWITESAVQILSSYGTSAAFSFTTGTVKGAIKGMAKSYLKRNMKSAASPFLKSMLSKNFATKAVLGEGSVIGKFLNKSSLIDRGAVQAGLLQGAMTVAGMDTKQMIDAGFTVDESYWHGVVMGGFTYLSENIFQANVVTRAGAKAGGHLTNKLFDSKTLFSKNAALESVDASLNGSFRKIGINSAKEATNAEKRTIKQRLMTSFAKTRSAEWQRAALKTTKDVAYGAIEEGIEEYAEGIGQGKYAQYYLNGLMREKAKGVIRYDNQNNIFPEIENGEYTGRIKRIDKNGNSSYIPIDVYHDYKKSLKLAKEVSKGDHDFAEEASFEEALGAFLGTLVSLGAMHSFTKITDHEDKARSAAEIAFAIRKDSRGKMAEDYKNSFEELVEEYKDNEIQSEQIKIFNDSVSLYLDIIDKYGLDDENTTYALMSNKSLLMEVADEYIEMDKKLEDLKLLEENKEVDWKKYKLFNVSDKEGLQKLIEKHKERISEYLIPKKGLVDKQGNEVKSETSMRYSRMFNYLTDFDEYKKLYASSIAAVKVKDLSHKKSNNELSEYEKAYKVAYDEALNELDNNLLLKDKNKINSLIQYSQFIESHLYGKDISDSKLIELSREFIGDSLITDDMKPKETFAHRYRRLIDKLMNSDESKYNEYYDTYDEDYFSEKISKLEKEFASVEALKKEKGKEMEYGLSLSTYAPDVKAIIDDVMSRLSKTNKDTIDDKVKENITSLVSKANKLYSDTEKYSGYEYNAISEDVLKQSLSGTTKEAQQKELTPDEIQELKVRALIDTIGELRTNNNISVYEFIDDLNALINDNPELSEAEALSYADDIANLKHNIDFLENYLSAQKKMDARENDKDKKEHSPLLDVKNNPRVPLNSLKKIEDFIRKTRDTIDGAYPLIESVAGVREDNQVKERNSHNAAKYGLFDALYKSGKLPKTEAITKAFEKLSAVEDEIRELAKEKEFDKKTTNLFDLILMLYNDSSKGAKEVKIGRFNKRAFVAKYFWEIEKSLMEIIDDVSGKLDTIVKEYSEMSDINLHSSESFEQGTIIDNSEDLYSSSEFNGPGMIKFFKNHFVKNSFENTNLDYNAWSYGLTMLHRYNQMGQNGSPKYSEILEFYLERVEGKIKDSNEELSDSEIQAYLNEGKGNTEDLDKRIKTMHHASSFAQMEAVIQAIGFLYGNKPIPVNSGSFLKNSINIRGYAGAGKTTQILIDAVDVFLRIEKSKDSKKKPKILFVHPSDALREDFKNSLFSVIDKDSVEMDYVYTNDFIGKDLDSFDLVLFDEASLLRDEEMNTGNKNELGPVSKKINSFDGKIIFASDNDQIADIESGRINSATSLMEGTMPVTEVFRTGVLQFVKFTNAIRKHRAELTEELFKYPSLLKKEGEFFGGEYAKTTEDVINAFIERFKSLTDSNYTVSDKDLILIVTSDQHYKDIIDLIPSHMRANVKVALRSDANDKMISGISSREVFAAIDVTKDSKYLKASESFKQRFVDMNAKNRILLTSVSRATTYLMLANNGTVDGVNVKFKTHGEPTIIKSFDRITQTQLNLSDLDGVKQNLEYILEGKRKNNPPPPPPPPPGEETMPRSATPTNSIDNETANNLIGKLKLYSAEARNLLSGKKRTSQIFKKSGSDTNNEVNRIKNRFRYMLSQAALFVRQDGHFFTNEAERMDQINSNIGISKEIQDAFIEYATYEKNKGVANKKEWESLTEDEKTIALSKYWKWAEFIELPAGLGTALGNPNVQVIASPVFANNDIAGNPFSIEVTGFTSDNKPIVNIHLIRFTDKNTKLGEDEMNRLAAYALLMDANGVKVNMSHIYTMQQIKAKAEEKDNRVILKEVDSSSFTPSDMSEYLVNAAKEMSISDSNPYVSNEELYYNKRNIQSYNGYTVDDVILVGNDRTRITKILAQYNGSNYDVTFYSNDFVIATNPEKGTFKQYNPLTDDNKFESNVTLYNSEKLENQATSWFPHVDISNFENKDDFYSHTNKLIRMRNDMLKHFKDLKPEFNLEYSRSYDVMGRQGSKGSSDFTVSDIPMTINHVLKAVINDKELDVFSRKYGYDIEEIKSFGMNTMFLMNNIDSDFKNTEGYSNSVNETYADLIDSMISEFDETLSFSEFKTKFKDQLDIMFSNSFEGDKLQNELIEYNKDKLYLLLSVASGNAVTVKLNKLEQRLQLSDPIPINDLLSKAKDKNISLSVQGVKYIGIVDNKPVYTMSYKDEMGLSGTIKVIGKPAGVPELEKVLSSFQEDSKAFALLVDIYEKYAVGTKERSENHKKTIEEFENSLFYSFLQANKRSFINENGEIKGEYAEVLSLKKQKNSDKIFLDLNGSVSNKLSAGVSLMNKLIKENNGPQRYMPVLVGETSQTENQLVYANDFAMHQIVIERNNVTKNNKRKKKNRKYFKKTVSGKVDSYMLDTKESVIKELNQLLGEEFTSSQLAFEFSIPQDVVEDAIATGELKFEDEVTDENCLKHGGSFGFTPGGSWSVIKNFKGNSHTKGGIDISVNDGTVSMTNNKTVFKAANGVIIAADGLLDELMKDVYEIKPENSYTKK